MLKWDKIELDINKQVSACVSICLNTQIQGDLLSSICMELYIGHYQKAPEHIGQRDIQRHPPLQPKH